eukprot:SAG11_NODE_131_length_15487_cov_5.744996_15_plen_121_part_00
MRHRLALRVVGTDARLLAILATASAVGAVALTSMRQEAWAALLGRTLPSMGRSAPVLGLGALALMRLLAVQGAATLLYGLDDRAPHTVCAAHSMACAAGAFSLPPCCAPVKHRFSVATEV